MNLVSDKPHRTGAVVAVSDFHFRLQKENAFAMRCVVKAKGSRGTIETATRPNLSTPVFTHDTPVFTHDFMMAEMSNYTS